MKNIVILGCSESNFVFSREKEGLFIRVWNTFYSVIHEQFGPHVKK